MSEVPTEYTVPADFRSTVDGKKMAASELKPGMKGTATVDDHDYGYAGRGDRIRHGVVLQNRFNSVTVLDDTDRMRKRFYAAAAERARAQDLSGRQKRSPSRS